MSRTKLLTINDVADLLNVHKDTVRNLVRDCKLTHIKLRGAIRFRAEDVDKWLERRTIKAKA
jgi:excisionase family DNA binding protein